MLYTLKVHRLTVVTVALGLLLVAALIFFAGLLVGTHRARQRAELPAAEGPVVGEPKAPAPADAAPREGPPAGTKY